jgi:hypothetical protein
VIDVRNDKLLTLAEASRLPWLPRRGRPIAFSTLYRWAVVGVIGTKLETVGAGTMYTTERALVEFFRARGARPIRTISPRRNPSSTEMYAGRAPLPGAAAASAEAERIFGS